MNGLWKDVQDKPDRYGQKVFQEEGVVYWEVEQFMSRLLTSLLCL